MILTRRTEPMRAVLSFDSALRDVSVEKMQHYLMTRDMSVLPELDTLPDRPTVFHVMPLLPRHEYLLHTGTPDARREMVRQHVVDVENIDGIEFDEPRDGIRVMTRASAESLPLTAVNELATMIMELQTRHAGELDFFTPPETWRSIRRSAQTLRLIA